MMQTLIVALIVVAAALHVARKYLPAGWREKLVYALRGRGTRPSRLANWVDTASGCGSGCDTCKSCATPAAGAPTEHVIKIVRR
ncbi:DUF6587 family protein [Massilia sp. DWR3-1-1]|uniref:DUF6587 family protein n=1 Tax=Massilia sp. DWR3-1-1 TaxID=2804559 RepID=UPI003CF5C957